MFRIAGPIREIQRIAVGSGIREIHRLRKFYGPGRWRELKGIAEVELADGRIRTAEIHWYEATGIGKKEFKTKRFLD
jgi:hypothetical protein